ncbi:YeeE/YedE thiosulfate transporter family protein [Halobacteriovorax sp. GB3]|uniref:YeeE/YedE family protein n=1 Tax=Halobacteriovorax sp. GB3 TaxID=2719615 RepID=UPI0023602AC7|nr:YeeE/YedE thiosulfate transporter family protein [Halobacteriovorax sp. GB3]MDD0853432.1 YeeE/YedE thiosulfate transporter family protein [Halobacteriovorax sp. GB3]
MTISTEFTPLLSLVGGMLIGLSATVFLASLGKIAGISGIARNAILSDKGDRLWRWLFLLGLVFGGFITVIVKPDLSAATMEFDTLKLVLGAILVGAGTTIGSGCTSGHGICGLSRLSVRSLIATLTFMFFGLLTVFVLGQ